jgi:hypothetical protein
MGKLYVILNRPVAEFFSFAMIIAQERENLLLNWISSSQSRSAEHLMHNTLKTQPMASTGFSMAHISHKS